MFAQRHKPIDFTAEGSRLALSSIATVQSGFSGRYFHFLKTSFSPDLVCDLSDEPKLTLHVVPGKKISRRGGGEAALRAYGEVFHRYILGSLLDPAQQFILRF